MTTSRIANVQATAVHGTAVAIGSQCVLLTGPPGVGKSELAMALVDRGAKLVADDLVQIIMAPESPGLLLAVSPLAQAGQSQKPKLALRNFGIVDVACEVDPIPLSLVIALDREAHASSQSLRPALSQYGPVMGLYIPQLHINPASPATALKVELALVRWGL